MSISPIQMIAVSNLENIQAGIDDYRDKYLQFAVFDGTTGTTPAYPNAFAKGCLLIHKTDGTLYENTAADGAVPSWTIFSGTTTTLLNNHILVGNAGNVATDVAMSGDVAIVASGATTIQANAITTSKIINDAVTYAKIQNVSATNRLLGRSTAGAGDIEEIPVSHVTVFAGQPTTVGGAATEAFTVTGAAATDLAFVQVVDNGTSNVTVLQAVVTLNTLTVTFSADPGNDTVINYQLIRAI